MADRDLLRTTAAALLTAGFIVALDKQTEAQEKNEGQIAYNNACRTCHTTDEGDNRLGPNLHNIIGRKAGAAEGYNYSSAMKNAGFTWDEAKLDAFIANPDAVVSGNNMKPFSGITDEAERKKIVDYLASEGR
ncbi:c-type cytochrome [Filomicrobium sp.]|uniref:c-type cytochrome n=1 Tax=Filomicrobium sp. TaxID=2024831 RepID=UPI002586F687|nr:c-type cytochrome [Filomicrobium sp.]MCV0369127.1 c-type cytochrome [Filomicrobium sp.]